MSELATVLARLHAIDGYHALTVPCPKCGDDVLFHLDEGHGACFATEAERPCGCRLGIRHLTELDRRANAAIERLLETPA